MNEERHMDLLNPPSTDFSMLDYECAYLPNQLVRMYYKYIQNASKTFTTAIIARGWRRFGKYFFHPICNGCDACKSIRIDVPNYIFSKSQRKVIRKNKETQIIIQKPTLTQAHLDLYNKYHAYKHQKDGWSHRNISHREYHENFVDGAHDFGKEILYIVDEKLIGVDLIDILDDGISAIYFYYNPDYGHLSLGTYSLLYQIKLAQILELPYIYLGYWVDGCKAFSYKSKFQPQEILDGFPHISEIPEWELWK
ncbi:MAG: arginyltransferase [Sulfurovum sp.]|nr:arginyltransferase [Sulfurovum sp.]MCB4748523.1 arginyltransferase [Sulfurovum sp.]MCB4751507.1 arginyltransferase [Sulfurovum sp.]MCB4758741.1 arginyltransferase [Sulfurovum sp.]MCB4765335.1 arginyltransferase [Sulfurovum sp.]